MLKTRVLAGVVAGSLLAAVACAAPPTFIPFNGDAPMITGDSPATSAGWTATPIFTVGHEVDGYLPTGILDGTAAFKLPGRQVGILVNSELNPGNGYPYQLANGTVLTGARVQSFTVDKKTGEILGAGLAHDAIHDRSGTIVTAAAQINETGNADDGLARLCSARGVPAGWLGFADDVYLTGEESSEPFHPHGGSVWALDVAGRALWAVPAFGRGAWENVSPVWSGNPNQVALLGGDDRAGAPLYLYVGTKNALGDGSFLDRNGLAVGELFAWKADSGSSPEDFNGQGASRAGEWLPIAVQDPAMAGMPGYDAAGYKNASTLDAEALALGAFEFSRPEDLHENPNDPSTAVLASTGRGSLFPSDDWGTLYTVSVDVASRTADLTILYDGDDGPGDFGIRSPDNLTWADDGYIYVQEDRSTSINTFGGASGVEASIWRLDPANGDTQRMFHADRSVVLPAGSTDGDPDDLGDWETSGILDVSSLFPNRGSSLVLLATVQAHSVRDGAIGDDPLLDEGGQLVLITRDRDARD